MLRNWFTKKLTPLSGSPTVRRLKIYPARTGYVYHYFFEGHRPLVAGGGEGTEFVFSISADGKAFHPASVYLPLAALDGWEQARERRLAHNERYAVAKLALFQAFDERPLPADLHAPVQVRPADVDAIIEMLGL